MYPSSEIYPPSLSLALPLALRLPLPPLPIPFTLPLRSWTSDRAPNDPMDCVSEHILELLLRRRRRLTVSEPAGLPAEKATGVFLCKSETQAADEEKNKEEDAADKGGLSSRDWRLRWRRAEGPPSRLSTSDPRSALFMTGREARLKSPSPSLSCSRPRLGKLPRRRFKGWMYSSARYRG